MATITRKPLYECDACKSRSETAHSLASNINMEYTQHLTARTGNHMELCSICTTKLEDFLESLVEKAGS